MTTLYGISNCDTIRKARKWLEAQQQDYQFHDVRKDGLSPETLNAWVDALGWEALLNRRGTTFRQLPEERKAELNQTRAIELMLEFPAMIKRPVLDYQGSLHLGFSAAQYADIFGG